MDKIEFSPNYCIIIAEAGINHNGNIDIALEMINQAATAGVDIIKFQTVSKEVTYNFADYNNEIKSFFEQAEFSEREYKILQQRCQEQNIIFMSSCADVPAVGFLNQIKVPGFKVSSGNFTNHHLIKELSKYNLPIIFSTGMSDKDEIIESVNYIKRVGIKDFALTYCISEYPADYKNIDFSVMQWMSDTFKIPVGFSDHTTGILSSIVARSLGACIIEKHFTLDKSMPGPDHSFSLLADDFKQLVDSVRDIEKIFDTSNIDTNLNSEGKKKLRRSMYYNRDIRKGETINFYDIAAKRPFDTNGISPTNFEKIIGKTLLSDVNLNQLIKISDFR